MAASGEFVRLGYLVAIPMRQGFSKSGGAYIDPRCNFVSNGQVQAEDIKGALDTLVKRPDVDPKRVLLVGQSHSMFGMRAGLKIWRGPAQEFLRTIGTPVEPVKN